MIWMRIKNTPFSMPLISISLGMAYIVAGNMIANVLERLVGRPTTAIIFILVVLIVNLSNKVCKVLFYPCTYAAHVLTVMELYRCANRPIYMARCRCPTCGSTANSYRLSLLMRSVEFRFPCGYQVKEVMESKSQITVKNCMTYIKEDEDTI